MVLCTHNGSSWVKQQLDSLFAQQHPVSVRVFDDASTDDTLKIIEACSEGHDVICVQRARAVGVVNNFAQGIQSAIDEGFDYIALSDQDDVWEPDRISQGLVVINQALKLDEAPTAQLAHSDLTMVDENNAVVHPSFINWRGYRYDAEQPLATVLGQNGVMGNTILMSRELAELSLPFPADVHMHDYWLALVAELLGERHYIHKPLVNYRIHDANVSNSADSVGFGFKARLRGWSLKKCLQRDFHLPFKEDSRAAAVRQLLTDPRFNTISADKRRTIEAFEAYLQFKGSRSELLVSVIKHRFLKPSWRHRLRVYANILTTQRY